MYHCRLIDTLDQVDTRVEKLRKEALSLCEKRDVLLMSMDIIKNNELLQGLNECEYFIVFRFCCFVVVVGVVVSTELMDFVHIYVSTDELEEVTCYSQRINSRLATIELCVKTVRDAAQEEALHQVNSLIDSLITSSDRILARQRCQTFLNGCSFSESSSNAPDMVQAVDKKFEMAVLGCTLDDQKVIKKRLQALMTYLNKQTVSD